MDGHDYYAPHAPAPMPGPVALIGFAGAGVAATGNHLRLLTGWPIADIEREVEHAAGCSIEALLQAQGAAATRPLEAARVLAHLDARPPTLLILGPDALATADLRAAILERATLIYLRRPLPYLAAHLPAAEARRFALVKGCDLRAALAAREPDYRRAHLVLRAGERPPLRVAQDLRRRLLTPRAPLSLPTEPP